MHGSISPPLVEKPSGAVEMFEIGFIYGRAPEGEVCDFEIGPEVAGGVAVGDFIMFGPTFGVGEPGHGVPFRESIWVICEEFHGFGPEGREGLRGVVDVDGEAVGFVVVAHPAEDVVVDVAVEVDVRFDAPVVLHVFHCRVVVEHSRIPATHLVVGFHAGVSDFLLFEDLAAFLH